MNIKPNIARIGLSTGCNYRARYDASIGDIIAAGGRHAEWSAQDESSLNDALLSFSKSHAAFDSFSFHAPDKFSGQVLDILSLIAAKTPGTCKIVVHPHVIHDIGLPDIIAGRILVENLDCRPIAREFTHKGAKFLEILRNPAVSVVLDIAHALSVQPDPRKLLDDIRPFIRRIAEVHLSFFDDRDHHAPLSEDHPWWNPAREVLGELRKNSNLVIVLETPAIGHVSMGRQIDIAQRLLSM